MMEFWEVYFKVKMWFVSWKCFFVGHDENMGYPENYQDPYCERCLSNYPQDKTTFPQIKENVYWRFIEIKERKIK